MNNFLITFNPISVFNICVYNIDSMIDFLKQDPNVRSDISDISLTKENCDWFIIEINRTNSLISKKIAHIMTTKVNKISDMTEDIVFNIAPTHEIQGSIIGEVIQNVITHSICEAWLAGKGIMPIFNAQIELDKLKSISLMIKQGTVRRESIVC